MPQTTLSNQGLVVFPNVYRIEDGLKPGQTFEVERTKAGEYIFRRKEEIANRKGSTGLTDALLKFQKLAPGEKLELPDRSMDASGDYRNPFE